MISQFRYERDLFYKSKIISKKDLHGNFLYRFDKNFYSVVSNTDYDIGEDVIYFEKYCKITDKDLKEKLSQYLTEDIIIPQFKYGYFSHGAILHLHDFTEQQYNSLSNKLKKYSPNEIRYDESYKHNALIQCLEKCSVIKHYMYRPFEYNICNYTNFFDIMKNMKHYISIKLDGRDLSTVFRNGKAVISDYSGIITNNNFRIKDTDDFLVQGEMLGDLKFENYYVFTVYNLTKNKKYNLDEMLDFCYFNNLKHVEILGNTLNEFKDLEHFQDFVDHLSYNNNTQLHEGVVVRNYDMSLSFKAISRIYEILYPEDYT